MSVFFFKATITFYFAGTILFLLSLWSKKEIISRSSWWVTMAGFTFHSLALYSRMREAEFLSNINLHQDMSFFSWALLLTFLIVEYRYRTYVFGSFLLPLAFLSLISAAVLPDEIRLSNPQMQNTWLYIHTRLSLLGMVGFSVAAVCGVMYLIQDRFLKSKRFTFLYYKLPSLDLLDELNRKAIVFGFPLLTIGILTGALWAHYARGSYWIGDPKEIFSLVTWLFYLVILHGRLTIGWRAKKAAFLAIIGFSGVVFTFIGVLHFI